MNRRHLTFDCKGELLVGTLDYAASDCGLLIVSGGNETRAGAWAGQAQLSARIAKGGHPVFRYDRRGVGDSEGANSGFHGAAGDLAAALAAFRREAPHLRRVVAFGNCDGASMLALFGPPLGLDALVLANPWTLDRDEPAAMSAAAVRSRYLAKLSNPSEWLRLLSGKVNLKKLITGMQKATAIKSTATALGTAMHDALRRSGVPVTILLADGDRTAQLFAEAWPAGDARIRRIASRSHSFSEPSARDWLHAQLMEALGG